MKKPARPNIDYAAFIKDKHERLFNTPEKIIKDVILKATGSPLSSKVRIIKGEANEVHAIKTEDGQEVIIRIGHNEWAKNSFVKEKWALEACKKIDVPVPTVLHLENIEHQGKSYFISIENKLPGVQLNELTTTKKSEIERLIGKSGEILAKIHTIKTNGFGALDAKGKGEKSTLADTLDNKWIQEEEMASVAKSVELDPKIIIKALEILRDQKTKFQVKKPSLVHCDFVPKHILVDEGKITGIIDFQNAIGGDPVRDFAYWEFFEKEKYPFASLKIGYTDKTLFGSDFERRMAMWKVYLGLTNLGYYKNDKNQGGINHCKLRLIEDIKLF